MQHIQIVKHSNTTPTTTLFFAGWGMDEHPFSNIKSRENDVIIVYDYRFNNSSIRELEALIAQYSSINLIAWSMGVWGAAKFFANSPSSLEKIKQSTAINGTLLPTDSLKGIPLDIYNKTIENLPNGLPRFNLRMCGGKALLEEYNMVASKRGDDIKDELIAIRDESLKKETIEQVNNSIVWDRAIIADRDLIIPTANQINFWQEYKREKSSNLEIKEIEGAHYIFSKWNNWEF